MSEKRGFLQSVVYGLEKFGEGICKVSSFLARKSRWGFELRKLIMGAPVVLAMLALANECRRRLPETVGIILLESGDFERLISRDVAILATMIITSACLVFMLVSKKTVYPWLVSIMSLLLPILLIVTNIFPA